MSDADKPASLPQLQEMAEGIARLESQLTPDARIAVIAEAIAPIYAELERLKSDSDFRFQMQAQRDEARATIDRMRKLLGDLRSYVKHDRLCVLEQHDTEDFSICKCGLKALLTGIDAVIGGK